MLPLCMKRYSDTHYTDEIPIEFLKECFEYNPETGILIWKERPLHHFSHCTYPLREHPRFNTRYAGRSVGAHNRGYLQTRIHYNRIRYTTVNVHRICWAIITGAWPKGEIDHINAIHDDNRFCNLQDSTRSENQQFRFNRQTYEPSDLQKQHYNRQKTKP
jgi:hypothetical protein